MIPPLFGRNNPSEGERILFDQFKRDSTFEDWNIFHSFNVKGHERKKWGEIDFICVIPKHGVVCLEVKGHHNIEVSNREWFFSGKRKESPFRQVESASEALLKNLHHNEKFIKNIPWFHGVIFTHCELPSGFDPSEFNRWQFIGPKSITNNDLFAESIKTISKKGLERQNKGRSKRAQIFPNFNDEKVVDILKQDFVLVGSKELNRLSLFQLEEDQKRQLKNFRGNKKIFIDGYAGSGKSVLAQAEAQAFAKENKKVIFICPSEKLSNKFKFVEDKYDNINVVPFSKIKNMPLIDEEDILIIDEAQDILGDLSKFEIFKKFFKEYLISENTFWRFFGDASRQNLIDFDEENFWKVYENFNLLVNENSYSKYMLRDNYRNKKKIVNYLTDLCDVSYEDIKRQDSDTNSVIFNEYENKKELVLRVYELVEQLIIDFSLEEITILSMYDDENSSEEDLIELFTLKGIKLNNTENMFIKGQINFSSVKQFRGLESQIIIAIDFNQSFKNKNVNNHLYTAFTRTLDTFYIYHDKNFYIDAK